MRLDSARELKAALHGTVLAPLSTPIRIRSLDLAAKSFSAATRPQRTIALGIAKAGRNDFRLAVRLQRRELEASPELDTIRRQAKGEIDQRYIGRVARQTEIPWHQQRCRPLLIGCSIGHYQITAGTLGCFVKSRTGGQVLILSNNHVLANENAAKSGDAILQPGKHDGGRSPKDVVGELVRSEKLKKAGPNFIDAAVCSIADGIGYTPSVLTGLGTLAGLGGDPAIDDAVAKIGRTTGLTHGRVTAFEMDNVFIDYDLGTLRFDNQIEIEGDGNTAFSRPGDSGSLIVNKDLRGVGLLFAGSDIGGTKGQGLTYAHPLPVVLDALKVNLLYS